MSVKKLVLVMAAVLTFGVQPAGAGFIDTFDFVDTPNPWPVTLSGATTMVTITENGGLGGVIGGERVTVITRSTTNGASTNVQVSVEPAPDSFLNYNPSVFALGTIKLTYDGTTGDLGADLSGDTEFRVAFIDADLGTDVTLTLMDGTTTSTLTKTTTGGAETLIFDYSDPAFAGLNFSSINSVVVLFEPATVADDFAVDFLQSATAIPEPSTLALLGIGVTGLVGSRLRRRRS